MHLCLIGSMCYTPQFLEAESALTLHGHVVSSIVRHKDELNPTEKEVADLVHMKKIAEADAVVLVCDEHIGDSVRRELMWCGVNGIPIAIGLKNALKGALMPSQVYLAQFLNMAEEKASQVN